MAILHNKIYLFKGFRETRGKRGNGKRSLLWLPGATRPDLVTIICLFGQHTHRPTQDHVRAVKYAIRYLEGTKHRGISIFSE